MTDILSLSAVQHKATVSFVHRGIATSHALIWMSSLRDR